MWKGNIMCDKISSRWGSFQCWNSSLAVSNAQGEYSVMIQVIWTLCTCLGQSETNSWWCNVPYEHWHEHWPWWNLHPDRHMTAGKIVHHHFIGSTIHEHLWFKNVSARKDFSNLKMEAAGSPKPYVNIYQTIQGYILEDSYLPIDCFILHRLLILQTFCWQCYVSVVFQ
jgi:hypothetical protein